MLLKLEPKLYINTRQRDRKNQIKMQIIMCLIAIREFNKKKNKSLHIPPWMRLSSVSTLSMLGRLSGSAISIPATRLSNSFLAALPVTSYGTGGGGNEPVFHIVSIIHTPRGFPSAKMRCKYLSHGN